MLRFPSKVASVRPALWSGKFQVTFEDEEIGAAFNSRHFNAAGTIMKVTHSCPMSRMGRKSLLLQNDIFYMQFR